MKKLLISVIIFTSTILLSNCACNTGCGGSSFDSYTSNCCGASSSCCGTGGW